MDVARRALSAFLTGAYGCLAGGMFAGLATFWMYALGGLIGAPTGFVCGALIGWKVPLRDAVILFSGCLSALAALNWIGFALGSHSPSEMIIMLAIIAASGTGFVLARRNLSLAVRYYLAWILTASCVVNVMLIFVIRT